MNRFGGGPGTRLVGPSPAQLPKLTVRVRFPSPAPLFVSRHRSQSSLVLVSVWQIVLTRAGLAGWVVCRWAQMPGAGPMIRMCDDQESMRARACPGYAPGRAGQGVSQ